MSSTLQKIRSSKSQKEPKDLLDLDISGQYAVTNGNELFLRYDNKSRKNRIIIFVDNQCLKILSESDQWFMDSTFNLCQYIQYQNDYWFKNVEQNLITTDYFDYDSDCENDSQDIQEQDDVSTSLNPNNMNEL
ncbi:unnamed protein product [Brachionus calyciflorus]|uniref:Uncharacterized protein n=1 Tax=Brachionus calyciflorus TaxID=104777 RepID=A0A814I4J9_9BILA|nr:unnamed protein product [Brachionus calyciflorus]